ncbi:MAG: EamA family transporter, partial [Duodenibacillus sp.]|nr:EamA family transporter [Duodenibacillus sp.]
TPLWTAAVSALVYRRLPRPEWYAATALAVAGIVCINGLSWEVGKAAYIALLLGDGLAYAGYIIISPRLLGRYGANAAVMLVLAAIAVCLLPAALFAPAGWALSWRGLGVCLGLGVFTAGFAFTFLTMGSKMVSAPVSSTLCLAEPMAAACLGIFLLGEPAPPLTLAGIALVFASIVILLAAEAWRARAVSGPSSG